MTNGTSFIYYLSAEELKMASQISHHHILLRNRAMCLFTFFFLSEETFVNAHVVLRVTALDTADGRVKIHHDGPLASRTTI